MAAPPSHAPRARAQLLAPPPEDRTSPPLISGVAPHARHLTDRYEFVRELGRGGMSVVYLARDIATGELVAMKLLGAAGAERDVARRFAREAHTVAALGHPNIARVLRVEEQDGVPFAIVSAYVPGESLRATLHREGALSIARAVRVLHEIASALAHAHERRIVHRDVKPENIIVDGESGRALLADFGIARSLDADSRLTAVGSSLGTPTYMAPEQIAGLTVDERADVYALGLVGWEMLAGQRPWDGETLYQVLHKQQHERLPALDAIRPDIPVYLLRAIDGALVKDPALRWRDAAELLDALAPKPVALPPRPARSLEAISEPTTPVAQIVAAPPTRVPAPPRVRRARRRWPAAAALVGLLSAVTLFASTRQGAVVDSAALVSLPISVLAPAPAPRADPAPLPPPVESSGRVDLPREVVARRRATGVCAADDVGAERACVQEAIDRHDVALRRAFQALLDDVRARPDARAVERALRGEQRAWSDARERSCVAAAPEVDGTPWPAARIDCFAQRSAERVGQLRARIGR